MSFKWDSSEIERGLNAYGGRVTEAIHRVAEYVAPQIEATAKAEAPWTDRTGHARAGLKGLVQDLSETAVAIYLTHSVEYGVQLELNYQARYSIVMPTLEKFYPKVKQMLDDIFR